MVKTVVNIVLMWEVRFKRDGTSRNIFKEQIRCWKSNTKSDLLFSDFSYMNVFAHLVILDICTSNIDGFIIRRSLLPVSIVQIFQYQCFDFNHRLIGMLVHVRLWYAI